MLQHHGRGIDDNTIHMHANLKRAESQRLFKIENRMALMNEDEEKIGMNMPRPGAAHMPFARARASRQTCLHACMASYTLRGEELIKRCSCRGAPSERWVHTTRQVLPKIVFLLPSLMRSAGPQHGPSCNGNQKKNILGGRRPSKNVFWT